MDPKKDDVYYKFGTLEKAADTSEDDPTWKFIASDETTDGHGDVIRAKGWDLKRYKKNPVVLFGHNHMMPVGWSTKTWIEGTQLMAEIKLATEGTSEFINTLRKLVGQKIVRAVSVGFRATADVTILRDDDGNYTGMEFNGQELLEISLVSVPANANSLATAKSLGMSEKHMQLMFGEDARVRNAEIGRKLHLRRLGVTSIK